VTYYDPTSKGLHVRFRWWLAWQLNRIPGTCWTHLVDWALGSRRLFDPGNRDDLRTDFMCRMPSQSGRCYCTKRAVEESP
jgi:hypothetical protein